MMTISEQQLLRLRTIYYLYLDECGNATFSPKMSYNKPNERYLTIGGVLLRGDKHWTALSPAIIDLKLRYFGRQDILLHFTDLVHGRSVFAQYDELTRLQFWRDFLGIIYENDCALFAITIDKQRMQTRYKFLYDPYHLILAWLIERLIYTLKKIEEEQKIIESGLPPLQVKVIIEARGQRQDFRLKNSYKRLYEQGNELFFTVASADVQRRLTSNEIAINAKKDRILGLEMADLVCNPLHWNTLFERCEDDLRSMVGQIHRSEWVALFWRRLRPKIAKSLGGEIFGYGLKLFPTADLID